MSRESQWLFGCQFDHVKQPTGFGRAVIICPSVAYFIQKCTRDLGELVTWDLTSCMYQYGTRVEQAKRLEQPSRSVNDLCVCVYLPGSIQSMRSQWIMMVASGKFRSGWISSSCWWRVHSSVFVSWNFITVLSILLVVELGLGTTQIYTDIAREYEKFNGIYVTFHTFCMEFQILVLVLAIGAIQWN